MHLIGAEATFFLEQDLNTVLKGYSLGSPFKILSYEFFFMR